MSFSYRFLKTVLTFLDSLSDRVNCSLDQSRDRPSFFSWLTIISRFPRIHDIMAVLNWSLFIGSVCPVDKRYFRNMNSVDIPPWSVPGIHKVLKPCNLLYLMSIS